MSITRRAGLRALGWGGLTAATLGTGWVNAQPAYPVRPLKILVGFPPGQATDLIARMLAQKFTEVLGQPVVVENRPGKGGSMGAEVASKAAADGYTLLLSATAPLATNPHVYPNLGYDPLVDFAPITLLVWLPFMLAVNPSVPVNSLPELIQYVKTKPGQLSYFSSGNGSTSHLTMEMMKTQAGLNIQHIPYKGSVPALADVISGQTQMGWDTAVFLLPHVKAGKLRALAVANPKRSALMPDIAAAAETLPGFSSGAWLGLLAPAGTPKEIIQRLNFESHKYFRTTEASEKLATMGGEVWLSTPDEFQAHIRSENIKWGKAVKDAAITLD